MCIKHCGLFILLALLFKGCSVNYTVPIEYHNRNIDNYSTLPVVNNDIIVTTVDNSLNNKTDTRYSQNDYAILNKSNNYKVTKNPKKQDFVTPLSGNIIAEFNSTNKGINLAAKAGTEIKSSSDGKVIYADYDAIFGYLIIIQQKDTNIFVSYAHLEGLILSKGDRIKQGEIIGYVGSSGKVKTPQLYFAIRKGKNAENPLKYVKFK